MTASSAKILRTFVAYVEDRPGVLNVGRTHEPEVSRMTFRIEADDDTALRIEANLYKMVNVLSVEDITQKASVSRDLALIKVTVGPDKRAEVLQLCEVFRARAVDVAPETLIVEITGTQDKIMGLLTILEPFGVLEMVQSGTVAMTRGQVSGAAKAIAPDRPRFAVA